MTGIWGQTIPGCGDARHFRRFGNIPDLQPLDAGSMAHLWWEKDVPGCWEEDKIPPLPGWGHRIRLGPPGEDSGLLFSAAETPEETAWVNQADWRSELEGAATLLAVNQI